MRSRPAWPVWTTSGRLAAEHRSARIPSFDEGRIVEDDTLDRSLRRGGRFAALARARELAAAAA